MCIRDRIGNTFFVSVLKLFFNAYGIPRIAALLSQAKFGWRKTSDVDCALAMRVQKSQVGSALLLTATSTLFAPMLTVFLLDDSCLRNYLAFAHDLRELMTSWGIGQHGSDAYRPGFCSRKLVQEFSYVWLTLVLFATFLDPAIEMLEAHPRVQAVQRRFTVGFWLGYSCDGGYRDTLEHCAQLQMRLVKLLATVLTMVSMSPFVPLLLLTAPVFCWIQICTHAWVFREADFEFGQRVAMDVLVQQPPFWFPCLLFVALWSVMAFVLIDLSFDVAPIAVFFTFSVATVLGTATSAGCFPACFERWSVALLPEVGFTRVPPSEAPDVEELAFVVNPLAPKPDVDPSLLQGGSAPDSPSTAKGIHRWKQSLKTSQQVLKEDSVPARRHGSRWRQPYKKDQMEFQIREMRNRGFWNDLTEEQDQAPTYTEDRSASVSSRMQSSQSNTFEADEVLRL
eukprot:TRINITY_DN14147_c0_g1_i2.p1 TRINITY_DN14147_c0_g1~~TRINITY_DN14147_c0_g1_i2.p1  ORF type:complete len:453 (+),score=92.29 TRINITY_DN14147_c0_g1_i2:99-1457(+)